MAISFPLAYPAVPYFRTVTFQPTEAIATTESPFSLATQIQRHQGQLWRAQLELPPMPRKDAAAWVAWLLAQRGGAGSFLLGQVPETVPLGQATGTPRIAGSHTRGVETISTDGWTASVAGIVKAGDLFQVGAGAAARLHQILVDASSNSSGVASLEILAAAALGPGRQHGPGHGQSARPVPAGRADRRVERRRGQVLWHRVFCRRGADRLEDLS